LAVIFNQKVASSFLIFVLL